MKKITAIFCANLFAFGLWAQCVFIPLGTTGIARPGQTFCQFYTNATGNITWETNTINSCMNATGCVITTSGAAPNAYGKLCFTVGSVPGGTVISVTATMLAAAGCGADTPLPTFSLVVLPIELSKFEGRKVGGAVVLNWQTLSEATNDHFTVERSFDGSKFEAIAEIKGAGNSNEINNYTFTDPSAAANAKAGIVYYRLSQTDFDGTVTTASHVVSVVLKNKKDLSVLAVRQDDGNSILDFQSPIEQTVSVQVFDINGRQVSTRQVNAFEGLNQESIELESLASGLYLVSVKAGDQISTVKFAK